MTTLAANLLTGIANISRLCMTQSDTDFEINMSLYPTKNELIIYVFKGGYAYAWRNPKKRIEKIRIDLSDPKLAAMNMFEAFTHIENMAKGHRKEAI
ncbi:hypothetical protein CDG60_12375 [Acinetobacter chinensis]|uniref:Uncharacterized protein n=1 Tax=Acinetobacter chinensis TaxID=2004650 RepID=A0A3B7M3T6_9GAMM|nr:hypothetical protein [Acinetobacter chinensis]AXY57293.1 hypothetical protein CDG60_12375 [Acinetobacter chinensis]